jgi:cytochrome c-type biogenesis protein CcmH/NrfG
VSKKPDDKAPKGREADRVEPGAPEDLGSDAGAAGEGPSLSGDAPPAGDEPSWAGTRGDLGAAEDGGSRDRELREMRRSPVPPVLSAVALAVALVLAALVAKPAWLGFDSKESPVQPERNEAASKAPAPEKAKENPAHPEPFDTSRGAASAQDKLREAETKGPPPEKKEPVRPAPFESGRGAASAEDRVREAESKAPPPRREAKKADPLKALLSDARRLRNRGKAEAALELYGRALDATPENADALAGRGRCYLDLSQYAPAKESFEAALEADAQHGDALMGLAETFRYEGRRDEAVQYYERYLAAHPRGESAAAARSTIEAMKE